MCNVDVLHELPLLGQAIKRVELPLLGQAIKRVVMDITILITLTLPIYILYIFLH